MTATAATTATTATTATAPADRWEAVIGLELHVQLATASKMFAPEAVDGPGGGSGGGAPNWLTSPASLGLPGALPTVNRQAVWLGALAGVVLGAQVHPWSQFDRKHYAYPDLGKGYQITQHARPLCTGGALDFMVGDAPRRCRIQRLHLEEDTAKTTTRDGQTLLDFNRAGVPLVEVVTEPDLRTPAEAGALFRALHEALTFAGVTLGDLEAGHMRCDANVSLRAVGSQALGERVEIKNVNSFRFIEAAVADEIARQRALLDAGQPVRRQTRAWDGVAGQSRPLRDKEGAHDYRYFPDPDLPPLQLDPADMEALRARAPEPAAAKRARYRDRFGLDPGAVAALTAHPATARYFEAALAAYPEGAVSVARLLLKEVLRVANQRGVSLAALPIAPASLAEVARLLDRGDLTAANSGPLLDLLAAQPPDQPRAVTALLDAHGLRALRADDLGAALDAAIDAAFAAHPAEAARLRAGEAKLLGVLLGAVMRALQGRADPATARAALLARLHPAA